MSVGNINESTCPIKINGNTKSCCNGDENNIPLFCELGMNSRKLFKNMYNPDELKISAVSNATKSLKINALTINNSKTGEILSSLETICGNEEYKIHTKWNGDSSIELNTSVTPIIHSMKHKFEIMGKYSPQDQACYSNFKASINRPYINIQSIISKKYSFGDSQKFDGLVINQGFVTGYKGNYFGALATISQDKGFQLSSSKLVCAYKKSDFELFGSLKDFNIIDWSVYSNKQPNFKFGTHMTYNASNSNVDFSVGAQCHVDDKTIVASKISSNFLLGFAVKHQVTNYATVGLSSELNLKNLNQPGHRFGLSLSFEA